MRLIPIIAAISLIALAPGAAIAQGTSSTGARMAADAERASDSADDKAALAAQWKDGSEFK